MEVLISVKNLVKQFDISGSWLDRITLKNGGISIPRTIVHAVNDVSLDINRGETLSIVGESGCGKSTFARTVVGLYTPEQGAIYYRGERIDRLQHAQMLPYRKKMQMVFQNPYASLNPRMKVYDVLLEPLTYHFPTLTTREKEEVILDIMEQVGIDPTWAYRFPHEFSGGQRQRIAIARALILQPECVVADEPISALDVSIQAQIINLLMDLQEKYKLTYLFISHDLSIVRYISSRVAVLYLGTLCEVATPQELFSHAKHPYTKALLSAIPHIHSTGFQHIPLMGEIPSPVHLPSGCVFHGRCMHANERCKKEKPELIQYAEGHCLACHAIQEGRID